MLRLSRSALHQLVWSKPITDIARQFDVSNLHIAQACDRFHISRPIPGYWQKVLYGKVPNDAEILDNSTYQANDIVIIDEDGWRLGHHTDISCQ